jgi:putative endonuclease
MTEGAWLYILRCADGSYYVGTTRSSLDSRIAQHNAGTFEGYTTTRRPVDLIFSQWFDQITDAIENERKLKNGVAPKRRRSSEAISRRYSNWQSASRLILRDARQRRAPQDEEGLLWRLPHLPCKLGR